MDSLKMLIERYANASAERVTIDEADLDGQVSATTDVGNAWHALELRLIELEAYLAGANTLTQQLGRPLMLIRGE